ncbi:TauD/TfdA dioxygenase family protein [Streptomyces subrutilus]|uniref:TauD/TfdA dioxygenase family protein n=1 Tax=Streptomyces subrutilus TaxID=36818 RepID=UPI000AF6F016|nr:TauD/TfdA family dioxygenase [Streptomyces subrutilus]
MAPSRKSVNPPSLSIPRAERTPAFGGDTQWTNTVAAYEGLSVPLRALVDGLTAEHAFFTAVHLRHFDERDREILKMYCEDPQVAVQPVVRVHPETGEKALFVSPGSTTRVTGFTELESRHRLRPPRRRPRRAPRDGAGGTGAGAERLRVATRRGGTDAGLAEETPHRSGPARPCR